MSAILDYQAGIDRPLIARTVVGAADRQFGLPIELSGLTMTIRGAACGLRSVSRHKIEFVVPAGVISALTEKMFHGIVLQAVMLTSAVLFAMLFLYLTRIIQPTRYFVMGVTAATAGICLFYLAVMILRMCGIGGAVTEMLYGNSWLSIGISLFVVAIAALNLIIDFGMIEQGVTYGAPKYMEWYGAFGLMVTLVWLYLEMLRLLQQIQGRQR
jgi:uncharacterized YccA/Bax inhibitor family protein